MNLYETRSQEWVNFRCLKPLWVSFHHMVSDNHASIVLTSNPVSSNMVSGRLNITHASVKPFVDSHNTCCVYKTIGPHLPVTFIMISKKAFSLVSIRMMVWVLAKSPLGCHLALAKGNLWLLKQGTYGPTHRHGMTISTNPSLINSSLRVCWDGYSMAIMSDHRSTDIT